MVGLLGISERVTWLEEMRLSQFYEEMAAADLICDQFGSSFPGMVTTDAFALGRPVMANLRNEMVDTIFWTIKKNYITKNDIMLLDIISTNKWKRPV